MATTTNTTTPPAYTTTLRTFHTLLTTSLSSLSAPPPSTPAATPPLSLLHDSATLTKAHTTRLILSLKPPSPLIEGIEKFLTSLLTGPIPALVLSVQLLHAEKKEKGLGGVLVKEVERGVAGLLESLRELGEEIKSGMEAYESGGSGEEGRGMQLVRTGRVWEGCERVVGVAESGLVGVVREGVGREGDLVKDAEEELKEWVRRCLRDSGKGSDEESENEDEAVLEEEEKVLVQRVSKRLRSTVILFFAVGKRRLGKGGEGSIEEDEKRLEEVRKIAGEVPEIVDDLVGITQEREWDEVEEELVKLDEKLVKLAKLAELGKDDKEDKFTEWFRKFRESVAATGAQAEESS